MLCGTGCRPPQDSKPANKTSIFRSHEFIVRVPTLLAATFSLIVFNDRLVRFVLHEKSVRVSIALEHNHPQSKGTNSTELILDSCSELLLDQYCLYKGSDLSVMALPTNWPSPGTGGASQRAIFYSSSSSTKTPNCHLLYFVFSYLVVFAVKFGTRDKQDLKTVKG